MFLYLIPILHSAYPDEVFTPTKVLGVWGMDLVLPCRYVPGPLANDPINFYRHTWTLILHRQFIPISSNNSFQDSKSNFTLTIVQLNPILAMYDYQCDIEFSNGIPVQPYNLRSSPTDFDAIDVMIDETDG